MLAIANYIYVGAQSWAAVNMAMFGMCALILDLFQGPAICLLLSQELQVPDKSAEGSPQNSDEASSERRSGCLPLGGLVICFLLLLPRRGASRLSTSS